VLEKLPHAHRPDVVDHVQRDVGFARFHRSGITGAGNRGKVKHANANVPPASCWRFILGIRQRDAGGTLKQPPLRLLFFQCVGETLGAMAAALVDFLVHARIVGHGIIAIVARHAE
jgi:hypothetical protein